MSGVRTFFDTNILLYMYGGEEGKRAKAKDIFRRHMLSGSVVLSSQVVQEFYVAGLRKLGMPRAELRDAVSALLDLPLVVVGPREITAAIRIEERHQVSFWDALILAAAAAGDCRVLYSEDMNDGQEYGSVTVRNPFRVSQ